MGEDAAAATASFLSWCDARGLVLDGVALRDAGDAGDPAPGSAAGAFLSADAVARGRGVYARRAFEPGEVVLKVPYGACLGTAGLACGIGRDAPPPFEGAAPSECLARVLIGARDDPEHAERWAPYVRALPGPEPLDTPTSGRWSRKEVAELQIGEAVFTTAVCLAKDAKAGRAFAAARKRQAERLSGVGAKKSSDSSPAADSFDALTPSELDAAQRDWTWAMSCVRSRAIELAPEGGGERQVILVPFVDMMNHSHAEPNVEWRASPEFVEMTATRPIARDEELLTSYGSGPSAPSESFALYQGFIGGHNPWDSVELFKTLPAAAHWYAETFKGERGETVVDVAKARGYASALAERAAGGAAGLQIRVGWHGRVSDELVEMLTTFNRQIMPDRADPLELAAHAVKVRCGELLASFATSAEEDLAMLEGEKGELSDRARLAVEFRLRKKAILQSFIHPPEGAGGGTDE
jgi:histone-lysine N-methyltransferase SETD3